MAAITQKLILYYENKAQHRYRERFKVTWKCLNENDDSPPEIPAPARVNDGIHARIHPSQPRDHCQDDLFVPDALKTEARQQVHHEKWQPTHDKHTHHYTQSFGSLLLFGKLGQFSAQREILTVRTQTCRRHSC